MNAFFASTASGLEELLKNELEALGANSCQIVKGGVHFKGNDAVVYRSLLWSRLASRILFPLNEFAVHSDRDLYLGVFAVDWMAVFGVNQTFMVQVTGKNQAIHHSQYGALRVKDAIVDSFIHQINQRPTVAKQHPDVRIHLLLQNDKASVALDLSGEGLHQRGYRAMAGQAPLKETLAAAVVIRSGWQRGMPMVDPMCGSGTLLIEAALMAADQAPGLKRQRWGLLAWREYQANLWDELMEEALVRARRGLQESSSRFFGMDIDARAISMAQDNARRAGVSELISFKVAEISQLKNPLSPGSCGTILSNPPYGERLENESALMALHNTLGRKVKRDFNGWSLSLLSASPALLSCLQLRAERQFKVKNGPLDCVQKNYRITIASEEEAKPVAPEYANRLTKNLKKLDKWARQQGIECYRLYDADLPEYNVAVDRYGDKIVIQEYAPPKHVDVQKARQRLFDVINATQTVMELPTTHLILKTRERQKGKNQYEKLGQQGEFFLIKEYHTQLWVNLTDYLDTGLFLDHRRARRMLGEMSKGKDFLNLFAYTGSASVYAGLGQARSTTTVDMSRTYLAWAERNLRANGLTGNHHRLIQGDCLVYLAHCTAQYDLIFVDPPTFSNSKRMASTFDVQRDHLKLLEDITRILRPGGIIMFSNNKRGFKMDQAGLSALGLCAQEITQQTLSLDFARHHQMHHCWLLSYASEEQ